MLRCLNASPDCKDCTIRENRPMITKINKFGVRVANYIHNGL